MVDFIITELPDGSLCLKWRVMRQMRLPVLHGML
jgi:hypothetical protein